MEVAPPASDFPAPPDVGDNFVWDLTCDQPRLARRLYKHNHKFWISACKPVFKRVFTCIDTFQSTPAETLSVLHVQAVFDALVHLLSIPARVLAIPNGAPFSHKNQRIILDHHSRDPFSGVPVSAHLLRMRPPAPAAAAEDLELPDQEKSQLIHNIKSAHSAWFEGNVGKAMDRLCQEPQPPFALLSPVRWLPSTLLALLLKIFLSCLMI